MTFTIASGFIGQFNTGDNINYNLRIVNSLYFLQAENRHSSRNLLRKPITVMLASIAEAFLHDLFWRMNMQANEARRIIAKDVLDDVQSKTLDKFETYIAACRKHDLLDDATGDIYVQLDNLRKLRNRIHIQNVKHFDGKERKVFTSDEQTKAERVVEMVARLVAERYPRDEVFDAFVDDFSFPWMPHWARAEEATS